jgi:integration host factor subunit beta
MTRSELVARVAARTRQPASYVEEAVDVIFAQLQEALREEGRAELRGFGSFQVKRYAAYVGHNPRTREPISVPEKRLPVFRAGKRLRELLSERAAPAPVLPR